MRSLSGRAVFQALRRSKLRVVGPSFVMVAAESSGEGFGVAFAVKKRVGNAVERNRIRRRLRHLLAELLPADSSVKMDFLLIPLSRALSDPRQSLKEEMQSALAKLGVSAQK